MFLLTLIAALDPIDGDFFDELVKEHGDHMYSIALKMLGNKEDAEDMVQETYIKVYRSIEKFYNLEREDTIGLLVIYTKNTVRDFYRKNKRRIKTTTLIIEEDEEEIEHDIADPTLAPEHILITNENMRRLAQYIDALPEGQRHAILLKYKYNFKDREMAEALGISETAFSSRLNRARESLRKMMGGEFDG
ncbi:MAG: sigma-70 family RNA polymerase sigma factor [Clostridia bacterium]|nr:sigma-70 family RNA polymerase sigma factor [Clostridia bacterium]